ncbi:hypothetical protein [Lentzea albidocapillata]|uniref:Uncharacterized protein n=1 Tax=Lentzea albidocapillata TaxID=40571 RepID=A0A1W2F2P6_9PSEU|nr:hypothetical protein [Lentzea albidocapillata]SMD16204.1 hypothetical protein SAMN05660733_04994 [Lentzea albidocapillata]
MKWFGLLGLAAVATLVAVTHRDIGTVLAIWFSGKQTSGATLWGLSMVWWGRAGKLLQFMAGCVVILDLVGPDRLRAIGARATAEVSDFRAWRSRMHEAGQLLELQRAISEWLITRIGSINKVNGDTRRWQLVRHGSRYLPDQPWFTGPMIEDPAEHGAERPAASARLRRRPRGGAVREAGRLRVRPGQGVRARRPAAS